MKRIGFASVLSLVIVSMLASISSAAPLPPVLTSPNGGETFVAGDQAPAVITWEPGDATRFNLYLSYDSGVTWTTTPLNGATKVTGSNSYPWTVPVPKKNKLSCRIKVVGYNDGNVNVGADKSDGNFRISVLSITAPNGGEQYSAGTINPVTWTTDTLAAVAQTRLSYSLDGGLTWIRIETVNGNPGSYNWTVPQVAATAKCRVMVELLDNSGVVVARDTSDAGVTLLVTPKTKASFSGDYIFGSMFFSSPDFVDWLPSTHLLNVLSSGAGSVTSATIANSGTYDISGGPDSYTVSADGQLHIGTSLIHGMLSIDNAIAILADTRKKDNDIGCGIAIKTSAGMSNANVSGVYLMGSIGVDFLTGNSWSELSEMTADGAGNATVHCLETTDPLGCGDDFVSTYTVNVDGSVTNSFGAQGAVTPDGKVFFAVDHDASDNAISFSVAMKKPSSPLTLKNLAGKFILVTGGAGTAGMLPWSGVEIMKLDGAGNARMTELYTPWPPLLITNGKYQMNADGTVSAGPTGVEFKGGYTDDGLAFFILDTDDSDGELSIAVGLKKTR